MQMLFKIIILITLALLGGVLYSFSANILIMTNILPTETVSSNFGYEMTSKAVLVWIVSVVLGIISLFIKEKWRYFLLLCPLVTPSLFALLYSLSHS